MTNLNRLDLNLLRIFDKLMQERSVSRAAQSLHLSQSTVSHALKRLRTSMDDPLFVMTNKEMKPTARALVLASPVHQALNLLEQGLKHAHSFDPKASQRVFNIAVSASIEYGILPGLFEHLYQRAPGCKLQVSELLNTDYERELESGELDLVVGFADSGLFSPKLIIEPWFDDTLTCLAPKSLELECNPGEDIIGVDALLALPHIYTSSWGHSQTLFDQWLAGRGQHRQIGVQVPTFTAVPKLLASGRYLVVLPEMIGRSLCEHYPLHHYRLEEKITTRYVMAFHPLSACDPAIEWFRDQLHMLTP
jgi:DNA-binding transcriptional LysR family regulator